MSLYHKMEGRQKTTIENPIPRMTLKKIEQLYHRKYSSSYITVVLVEKYIDDNLVNSWSWIQDTSLEEILEFPTPQPKRQKKSYADRKEYYKQYYRDHTNHDAQTRKTYKELTDEERKALNRAKAKVYYQRHKEEIKEKHRLYNLTHKDTIKEANRQYYLNKKKNK